MQRRDETDQKKPRTKIPKFIRDGEGHLVQLEWLFRNAPIGFAFLDSTYRFTYANDIFAGIHARQVEDLLGKTAQEVAPQLWPALEPVYRSVLAGEMVLNNEVSGTAPSTGCQIRHWLASHYPVRLKGEVIGIGVIVNDITELRLAEVSLRVRNELYAMLSRTNTAVSQCRSREELYREVCAIAVETGRFRFAWIGVPEGNRVKMVASAGKGEDYMAEIVISLEEDDPRSHGPTGRAALNGKCFVVNDFMSSPMTGPWRGAALRAGFAASAAFPLMERGLVAAVLTLYAEVPGFFTDDLVKTLGSEIAPTVSFALDALVEGREHEELEIQLRQSQKMDAIGQLAGGVAHDFNNLLTVILSYSSLVMNDLPPDSVLRNDLNEIHKAASTASDLTRQLLAFGRKQVLQPKIAGVNSLLSGMEGMLRRLLGEQITLKVVYGAGAGSIRVDPTQLLQVLMNLAVNGRDAMPSGGDLTIETFPVEIDESNAKRLFLTPGPYVLLSVRDTGVGMDPATLDHLFEPFFSTKEVGKGTGLGLATAYGIIRQSNGSIWALSEPGHGSMFKIFLPRIETNFEEPSEVASSPASIAQRSGPMETILLVEDDDQLRTMVNRILGSAGFRVLTAANGMDALLEEKSHQGLIELLLTDVVMPEMGGVVLSELFRKIRPRAKVLFMSGYTDGALGNKQGLPPSTHFLCKPFDGATLLHKVREVLNEATGINDLSTSLD